MFQYLQFSDLDPYDDIFTSLRSDYPDYDGWFARKLHEPIWVAMNNTRIAAILYLKVEGDRLKIGTLKVADDSKAQGLATAALKLARDQAILNGCTNIYGTIYPRHHALISFLLDHGYEVEPDLTAMGEQVFSRPVG
jgi:GNAT superfamily N-acetyltransferase